MNFEDGNNWQVAELEDTQHIVYGLEEQDVEHPLEIRDAQDDTDRSEYGDDYMEDGQQFGQGILSDQDREEGMLSKQEDASVSEESFE